MTGHRVFRSTAARFGGWLWMAFAAANLVDLAVRGRDLAALIATAVLLLGSGIAYVIGLRPRIVADDNGIRVHNPLRNAVIPWEAVQKITAADSVRIAYTGPDGSRRETNSWVLQTSPKARAKAEQRAKRTPDDKIAQYVETRTPAHFAAEQLTELVAAHRLGGPPAPADGSAATASAASAAGAAGAAGAGSGETPAGQVSWWPPAVAALVGPALLLACIIVVAALR